MCELKVYYPETKSWHLVREKEAVEASRLFAVVHTDGRNHPQTPLVPQRTSHNEACFYIVCTEDDVCASCQEKLAKLNHILGRERKQKDD